MNNTTHPASDTHGSIYRDPNIDTLLAGVNTSVLWRALRLYGGSLDTLRRIQNILKVLQKCERYRAAYQLVIVLYELIAEKTPQTIKELEHHPETHQVFLETTIQDGEQVISSYELKAVEHEVP